MKFLFPIFFVLIFGCATTQEKSSESGPTHGARAYRYPTASLLRKGICVPHVSEPTLQGTISFFEECERKVEEIEDDDLAATKEKCLNDLRKKIASLKKDYESNCKKKTIADGWKIRCGRSANP